MGAPRGGVLRRRARRRLGISTTAAKSSSATPWSCGTGCRGCGRRSRSNGCRRGEPAWSPRSPSTPTPQCPARRGRATPRSPRSAGRSVPRSWTGSSPRTSSATTSPRRTQPRSGGRLPRTSSRATPASTTTTSTSPARCASRPSSTSPTPSISTGPSRTASLSRRHSASTESLDVRRAMALGDLARTQIALDLFAGVSGARSTQVDVCPLSREVVLLGHSTSSLDESASVFGPTDRLEEGQRLLLLVQVHGLVHATPAHSWASVTSISPSA